MTRRNSVNNQRHSSSRRPPEVLAGTRNQALHTLNPPHEYHTRRADLDNIYGHFSHESEHEPEHELEHEPEFEEGYDYDYNDEEQYGTDFAGDHFVLNEEQSDSDDPYGQPDERRDTFYDPTEDDFIYQDPDHNFSQPDLNDDIPYDYEIGNHTNLLSEPDHQEFMVHSPTDDMADFATEHGNGTAANVRLRDESHLEGTPPQQSPDDDYILINTQLSQPRNSHRREGRRHRPIVIDATQPEQESPRRTRRALDSSPSRRTTRRTTAGVNTHDSQQPRTSKRKLSHLRSSTKTEERSSSGNGDGSGSGGAGRDELDLRAEQSPSKRAKTATSGEKDRPDPNAAPRPRIMFKCAVCLDSPDPAVFVHPCGHVFCETCAQTASQSTGKCPVCRHTMRAKDIRVLQFRVAAIKQ